MGMLDYIKRQIADHIKIDSYAFHAALRDILFKMSMYSSYPNHVSAALCRL